MVRQSLASKAESWGGTGVMCSPTLTSQAANDLNTEYDITSRGPVERLSRQRVITAYSANTCIHYCTVVEPHHPTDRIRFMG
jgi:hypothetical protein